jgi:hypothetical protein
MDADQCNLTILISENFVSNRASYDWWPNTAYPHRGSKDENSWTTFNLGGGSGKEGGYVVAAIIAIALVAATTEVVVHNVRGTCISLCIEHEGSKNRYDLEYGINRFNLSPGQLQGLRTGTATMSVLAHGPRTFVFKLPSKGWDFCNDINYIEFTPQGRIVVNGRRLETSGPPPIAKESMAQ